MKPVVMRILAAALLPLSLFAAGTQGPAMAATSFEAKGSVEQVYVTGVTPGATVTLHKDMVKCACLRSRHH